MNLIGVKINEAIDANLLLQDLQDWPQVRDALRAVKEIVNTQTAYYLEWDDEIAGVSDGEGKSVCI